MRACNPTRPPRAPAIRPLPSDQLTVPPENGVGRHDGHDSANSPASQAMAQFGETPTLVVIQTQTLSLEPCLQHPVLLAEERDHVLLLLLKPAAQYRDD